MHSLSTSFYLLGQGIKNIKRNKMFSLASVGTMTACLFLFGVFYFVLANFNHMVKSAEQNVGITVFFDFGISDEKIEQIGAEIRKRAEVGNMELTTADEAWEKYKEEKLDPELAETFGDDNPLEDSASYTVYMNDVSMQEALVNYIKRIDGVRKVNNNAALADTLSGLNNSITLISTSIIIILLMVATFLISTTVSMGISVRAKELSIMKLIGAKDSFIRTPYIVEGVIIGLFGALVPIFILKFLYGAVITYISEEFSGIFQSGAFLPEEKVFVVLVPIILLIGVGIGFLGSLSTVKRKIRKI